MSTLRPGPGPSRTTPVLAVLAAACLVTLLTAVLVAVLVGGATGLTLGLLALVLGLQLVGLGVLALLWRRSRAQASEHRRFGADLRRIEGRVVRQGRRLAAARRQLTRARGTLSGVDERGARVEKRLVDLRALNIHHRTTMERRAEQLHLGTERQVSAILDLRRLVPVQNAAPPLGGFAASPDLLVLLVSTLLERRPRVVLECGSGSSTLYLALAIRQHGLDCRVIALEHQEEYAAATRELLRRHGVDDVAEVRTAPLRPTGINGHVPPWYDQQALTGVAEVEMLVVDGPPGSGGPQARYPAVPLARSALAERCVVVLDDVFREDERATAERWSAELPDFTLRIDANLQKQVAVLTRG